MNISSGNKIRNYISLALVILSLGLLVPGLTMDILNIKVFIQIPLLGQQVLQDETRSILGTIENLYLANNAFVAFLILLFSVVIPFLKAVIMLAILLFKNYRFRFKLYRFVFHIGKWSMADVFVVGIFIAFLSVKTSENIISELHVGFYYFLGYCLTSLLASQLMQVEKA